MIERTKWTQSGVIASLVFQDYLEEEDMWPIGQVFEDPAVESVIVRIDNGHWLYERVPKPKRSGRFICEVSDMDSKDFKNRCYNKDPEYLRGLIQTWSGLETRWEAD